MNERAAAQANLADTANWIAGWLRASRFARWIIPSTCLKEFLDAVDRYEKSRLGHDEHGVDIPAQNDYDPEWRSKL